MVQQSSSSRSGSRVTLVDEIASLLRERIYTRHYPTGARLRQEQLSTELGVSRTPLREALRVLAREGLIRVEAGQGARVVSGDIHTLLAAYELRAVVDGLAARLAAERLVPGSARALRQVIDYQRAALDPWEPRRYMESNVDFHEQIMRLSGNEFVIAHIPTLRMTAQVFEPVPMIESVSALRAIDEHEAILDAIDAADGTDSERLAREHIEKTIEQLRRESRSVPANADESAS